MLNIAIPGDKELQLKHLILDYNGTLACDGVLLPGVAERLQALSQQLQIHVLTADTFGTVATALPDGPVEIFILPPQDQDVGKLSYIERLGPEGCVCVGNGRNDGLMLEKAALGIVVCQEEGTAVQTMLAADVVAPTIQAALDLLVHPRRLVATLRS